MMSSSPSIRASRPRQQMNGYRQILERKLSELQRRARRLDAIAIEYRPETLDAGQLAEERESASQEMERNSRLMAQVEAALARMSEGSFGTCLECGNPITPKRLAAVPWTRSCIDCQEQLDRRRLSG